jgi:hypothetical protein
MSIRYISKSLPASLPYFLFSSHGQNSVFQFGGSLFGQNPLYPEVNICLGRKGRAFASTPRSAPCLRSPVGYHALSLPGVLRALVKVKYWGVVFHAGVLCRLRYPTLIRIKHKQYIRSVSVNPIIFFSKFSYFLKNSPFSFN